MIWELRLQRGLVSMAAWPQVLEDPWQRGGAGRGGAGSAERFWSPAPQCRE